jgi:L-amino acid N-acyltransferase YncA
LEVTAFDKVPAVRPDIVIRNLTEVDWPAIAAIYQEGIDTRLATFETALPTWEGWSEGQLPGHRLVATAAGEILGWAVLRGVSKRQVYAGVAEDAVYVAAAARGEGVGRAVLLALLEGADAAGIWTVQAGVFPENEASLRLHESCGFRRVGIHERIGKLDGEWRDVVLLERRSPAVV